MVTTKAQVTSHSIREIDREEVSAIDLRGEVDGLIEEGRDYEIYEVVMWDERGDLDKGTATLLWVPDIERAGIAWGSEADWFGADSPKDAADLWLNGEWERYR